VSLPRPWLAYVSEIARIFLNMGGDYITEFLYVLLDRICFPYRDINLARSYDWNVMEELKSRLCTLTEVRAPQLRFVSPVPDH
jgi:actin-related protein